MNRSINKTFSDTEGNHLMVALDFCDDQYKLLALNIPEDFVDVEIYELSLEKLFLDKGIHFSTFFKMGSWLVE